jgi:N-acetylglucosaminyldiphosphoundecaprenol N-acetyl-beta-D-mannosaminyltransferase
MSLTPPSPVEILGVPVHPVSADELVSLLAAWGEARDAKAVFYTNVHVMNLAYSDAALRQAFAQADLVTCDGFGVKWGARLAGQHLPHRMTSPDWIDAFAARTAAAGQRVFAIGDEPGVAEAFQRALVDSHAGYADAGTQHGFFDRAGAENDALVERINESGAHHVLVGLGSPLQEHWILDNAPRLRAGTLIAVGALFRWRSGIEHRAPRWMTDHGLEWLGRLARHPVRHFRRYVVGNPLFAMRVLRERWRS